MQANDGAPELAIKLAVNGAAQGSRWMCAHLSSTCCASIFTIPAPRKVATMAPAELAPSSSTDDGCFPA